MYRSVVASDGTTFDIDGEEPPIVHDFLPTWTVADEALLRVQEIAQ